MFSRYSSRLSLAMKEGLNKVAAELIENPTLLIQISGHSDFVETKDQDTILSYKRAMKVKSILVQYGVRKEQILLNCLGSADPYIVEFDTLELQKGMKLEQKTINSLFTQESKALAHSFNRRITIDILRVDFIPRE